MRRLFGILVLVVLATACAGDDVDTTTDEPPATSTPTTAPTDGSTTSSSVPEALTASWPGVTEETIRLGVVTIDYAQLRELGFVDIDPGDPQVVLDALVAEINGRGGILGRRVEAHLETVLPIGTTEAEEACLRLTEDLEVFAVLGAFEGLAQEANPCITDLHETVQVGGAPTPEQLDRARAPWISDRMGAERRMTGAVALMDDAGLFGERIAVAAVADEERLARDLVIAELERRGHEVEEFVVLDTPTGDVLAATGAWETFIEKFRVEDIDTVVLVEGAAAFGANQLVTAGFDAQVLVVDATSVVGAIGRTGENPPAALAGIIGTDVATGDETFDLPASRDCISILEDVDGSIEVKPHAQHDEGEPEWIRDLGMVCRTLRIFERAATAAGTDLTPTTFQAGVDGIGEFELPFSLFASLGPGKWDASDELRLSEFDPQAGELGGATPYGPLVRIGPAR